jgi:hypothetical protein
MTTQDQIVPLYEGIRQLLINTDPVASQIDQIQHPQLKEKLLVMSQNIQADLMILCDFLYELMNCATEDEIELLLELHQDSEEIIN